MASTLPAFGECCLPCDAPLTVSVPGPQGPAGADGTNGAAGTNSYTLVTTQFVMPAVGASVVVALGDSRGFYIGQLVPVQFAGTMVVTSKPDQTHLGLKNSVSFVGNVVAGTVIPVDAIVGPAMGNAASLYNVTTGVWYTTWLEGIEGAEIEYRVPIT